MRKTNVIKVVNSKHETILEIKPDGRIFCMGEKIKHKMLIHPEYVKQLKEFKPNGVVSEYNLFQFVEPISLLTKIRFHVKVLWSTLKHYGRQLKS